MSTTVKQSPREMNVARACLSLIQRN